MALSRSQRLFELFLFIDIENNSADVTPCAAIVTHQAAPRAKPVTRAGTAAELERDIQFIAGPGDACDRLLDTLLVRRLQQG